MRAQRCTQGKRDNDKTRMRTILNDKGSKTHLKIDRIDKHTI
jgi:hypothetical protein